MLALRRAFLLGGLLAAASLSTGAHAAQISGSQAIGLNSNNGLTITPPNVALSAVTQFTLNLVTQTGGTSQTGDFVGIPSVNLNQTVLNTASLSTFSFTSATFGTFTATNGIEIASPTNTRTFYFSGNFTPTNPPFGATITANTASFLVNMNQSGGAGSAINFSGTFNTPAIAPPGVPEPASLAMAAVPALLGLVVLRKRAAK